jgi:nucleoside-diphosphate-sugar epimerase
MLDRSELVKDQNPPAVDPFPFVVANAAKLKTLGWKPAWSLDRGLEELIRDQNLSRETPAASQFRLTGDRHLGKHSSP